MTFQLRKQRTIQSAVQVIGRGYWSGQRVRVEFRPAAENTGIVFVRDDIESCPRIPALVEYRVEAPRRTNLVADGSSVEMVEHIMATLAGLCIDNCEVRVDAAEMPGVDGSSKAFVDALLATGLVEQEATRSTLIITEPIRVGNDDEWVEARPNKGDGLSVKYRLEYPDNNAIGRQTLEMSVTPQSFQSDLAEARTFVLHAEAEWLRQQGLGTHVTYQDLLVYGEDGPIDNELRFENECVRHKTLDLIGDLALGGCDLVGHIVAHRSGHRLNAELVRVLLSEGNVLSDVRMTA